MDLWKRSKLFIDTFVDYIYKKRNNLKLASAHPVRKNYLQSCMGYLVIPRSLVIPCCLAGVSWNLVSPDCPHVYLSQYFIKLFQFGPPRAPIPQSISGSLLNIVRDTHSTSYVQISSSLNRSFIVTRIHCRLFLETKLLNRVLLG